MSKSTKWFLAILGILAFIGVGLLFLFAILIATVSGSDSDVTIGTGPKIGVIELTGEIASSDEIVRQLKKFRDNRSLRALLLRVDSPGGGVVASQEIYEEVRKTRESGKPIVVSMGALAASGGYYVSCGANKIVANPGTLTGSIGVISQFMNVDTLLRSVGVDVKTIKSGKFKDSGSPFRTMTSDDQQYFQSLMDEVHRQFIQVVEMERKLDHDTVVQLADGRVFTGAEAVTMKLIDTLGTYEDAVLIAAQLGGIDGEPAIVKERKPGPSLFDRMFGDVKMFDLLTVKETLFHRPILQYRMVEGI